MFSFFINSTVEQSSIRHTHIVFSRHFKVQPLNILAFSVPQLSVFTLGIVQRQFFRTRLRLNFSALNYHLFQKNCCSSPACALCDASIEDVKPYFLYCPCFAALRENLFTSAAQLLWK